MLLPDTEPDVIDGLTGKLKNSLLRDNVESLARYIAKHNEYSNWEAQVWLKGENEDRTRAFAVRNSGAKAPLVEEEALQSAWIAGIILYLQILIAPGLFR